MTTTGIRPQHLAAPGSEARISLKPFTRHPGVVNGAWWPRSRDLTRELPGLIAVLDESWGQINRVTVNAGMWPRISKRVQTGPHIVRVGWFDAEQDPHDLCVISYGSAPGRWDLLVVPPDTEPGQAARLMAAASDVGNKQTASALLADAVDLPSDPLRAASATDSVGAA